jgi:hypothetical protein
MSKIPNLGPDSYRQSINGNYFQLLLKLSKNREDEHIEPKVKT